MEMTEYLFREVREDDADAIFALAKENQYHSDNLPQDVSWIQKEINKSLNNLTVARFGGVVKRPLYMFALEDTKNHQIVGVSQVRDLAFRLLYRICTDDMSGELALQKEDGVWELGGLLLAKAVRGKGLSKLLSYGRLLYLANLNIGPRILVSGFVADIHFWDRITAYIGISERDVYLYWRNAEHLYRFFRELPAQIFLDDLGISCLPIRLESEAARKLLMKMGLVFLSQIEADGVLWYGTPWKVVRRHVMDNHVSSERIVSDSCKHMCHVDMGIAVLNFQSFQACYVPIKKVGDFIYVSENDVRQENIRHLFIF